jgi:hypothetical protein
MIVVAARPETHIAVTLERNRTIAVELQLIEPLLSIPVRAKEALACVLRSIRLMKNSNTNDTDQAGLQRDPDEWKTGDEPMTAAQRSYLETLCRETGEEFDETLSKADASKRIDELRDRSPRLAGD